MLSLSKHVAAKPPAELVEAAAAFARFDKLSENDVLRQAQDDGGNKLG